MAPTVKLLCCCAWPQIRHWGLSNESTYGAVMHCLTADRLGVPRPVSIQNSFSLVHRSFESELAEACSPRHLNLGLLPWSALAGGSLTGELQAVTRLFSCMVSRAL